MINEFKTNFLGGTRSNRFEIFGRIPSGVQGSGGVGGNFTKFHVRSTIIPQMSTKTLSYDYFGRKYHYPGERDYGSWAFTVLDDTGNANNLWQMFQRWHNNINDHETNVSYNLSTGNSYKAENWEIRHLDINGDSVLKTFILQGCWPAAIQQVSLNMMQPNTLNSFNVIIVYDYVDVKGVTERL
jgi:hypothetical protein